MKGLIIKSTGLWYEVLGEDGSTHTCGIRGKWRLGPKKHSNPIAVGDRVLFDPTAEGGTITECLPRTNFMARKAVQQSRQSHVLAANIDQVLLIATMKQPVTSIGFMDRVLVTAESFRIPQLIIFNKNDLLLPAEQEAQNQLSNLYTAVGADVLCMSLWHDVDFSSVTDKLIGKTTLMVGLSGVGKSTFLNHLIPKASQTTKEISSFSKKGVHTTTYAELFCHSENTFVIDTPGLKEWGIVDMDKGELSDYFPEMRKHRSTCKYQSRCIHIHEPGCAVRRAVDKNSIAASRYKSYVSLIEGKDSRK